MVFQDYALWPHLTALDNVAFALRRRRLPRAECRARAASMLDAGGAGRVRPALPERAVRRAAAAGGAGPGADRGHRADPVRRAAVQPGRRPARADAGGDLLAGPRGRRDHRLHHPRPGRGVRAGGPHRGARGGRAGAGGHARGRLQPPGDPVRGPVHRAGRANCGSGWRRTAATARWRSPRPTRRRRAAARAAAGRPPDGGPALRPGDEALLAIRPTGVFLAHDRGGRAAPDRAGGRRGVPRPGLRVRHRPARPRPAAPASSPGTGPTGATRWACASTRSGCHLFPADDSGTSAVREYASA